MSAQTFFVVARAENALAVPVAALQPVGGNRGGGGPRARPASTETTAVIAEARAAQEPQKGEQKAEASSLPAETRTAREPRGNGERRARNEEGAPRARAYTVRVVKDEGKVEERRVTVGVMNRIQAQVLSGLVEGEQVVIGTAETETKAQPRAQAKGGAMRGRL